MLLGAALLGGTAALAQQDTQSRTDSAEEGMQAPIGPEAWKETPSRGTQECPPAGQEGTGGGGPAGQVAATEEEDASLPKLRESRRAERARQLGNDLGGRGNDNLGW